MKGNIKQKQKAYSNVESRGSQKLVDDRTLGKITDT